MLEKNSIHLPNNVSHIINTLNNNKYEAYLVGGCVRDFLTGKKPADWDIVTNAKTSDLKKLFTKTIDTGLKHGTITVVLNKQNYEITTYKNDGNLKDDLAFRDFTINAIAYHPDYKFIDPFSGMEDVKNSIIRSVGKAKERFLEDPLRMLRAIRLSSSLDFQIDQNIIKTIQSNCNLIKKVSPERIRDELSKILCSANAFHIVKLKDSGLLKHILPEFDICFEISQNHPYHLYNVGIHSLHTVINVENIKHLRWTMLLHDTGKAVTKTTDAKGIDHFYRHGEQSVSISKKILTRLRFDNKTINKVCTLVKHHDRRISPDYKSVKKTINIVGEDMFLDLIKVQKADKKGQNLEFLNERLDKLNKITEIYFEIIKDKHCFKVNNLAVNGQDLINIGFEEGKEIGDTLNVLLEKVIENPHLNEKDKLLKIALKSYKK
ncbi:HD domain-containing protein [Herbivorax sp. ANBcel31]|uniref:CCA tRNA nucleotidyltransferase n=1 Tax=Herbivorax sp. ANBcel31 TaxID=3069754 RepID=UPI0027ADAB25|nr:HD domain-containing protein [Herbivorax sp. ANBcel31]MDQ2087389.1 HD domain-containing protein [Herbivorax sp. ANBcel31]